MTTAPLSHLLILILALLKGTSSMAEPSEGSGLRKLQFQQDVDDDYGYADGADVAFSHNSQPPPYCNAVACGETYAGKVFLNDDLLCEGDIADGTAQDLNCAITLDGPGAALDCKGYSLYQYVPPQLRQKARNCSKKLGSPENIEAMKRDCGMYYVAGVCLKNGASLKNCGVQRYFHGVSVQNSATIQHSTMTQNTYGLRVNDDQTDDKTEVSYTEVSDNGQGGIMYNEKSLGKVVLENVRANINSLGVGMKLVSSNIKLKNAEASRNGYTGISITASDEEVEVKIEGTTVVRNNGNHGIMFRAGDGGLNPLSGNMKVGGKTYIYGNVGDGLRIPNNVHVNVEMGRSGTLYSCDNVYRDVFNNGDGKFDEKRVTCGSQEGTGDLPGCTEAQCSAVECPAP